MDMDFGANFGSSKELQGSVRRIPTFAGSQYGTIDMPITFTGDFEIECKFSTTSTDTNMALFADVNAGNTFLTVSPTIYQATVRAGTPTPRAATLNDGKVHTARLVHVSGNAVLFHDGVSLGSIDVGIGVDPQIKFIGRGTGGANLFKGQILSVKFTDKSGAEDVVTNYVFDSGSDLYQLPRGEEIGNELNGDPTCDNETYWDVTNGATFDGDGVDINYTGVYAAILLRSASGWPLVVGDNVVVSITISSYSSGGVDVYAGDTNIGAVISAGTHELMGVVTNNGKIQLATGNFVGTISKLSYKKLPDLNCSLTNFATTDWNRYTQQRNIAHDAGVIGEAWVGDNVVVNGRFNIDLSGWSSSINWIWESGKWARHQTGATNSMVLGVPIVIGNPYLIGNDVGDVANGIVTMRAGSGGSGTAHSVAGTYKELLTCSGNTEFLMTPSSDFDGYVDNVSVQHLLEVA